MKLIVTCLILFSSIAHAADRIDSFVLQKLQSQERISIIVSFQRNIQLAKMNLPVDRDQRLVKIRKTLVTEALRVQKNTIAKLQNLNINFKIFYIDNSMVVHGADLKLVQDLASQNEVVAITFDAPIRMSLPLMDLTFKLPPIEISEENEGLENNIKAVKADQVWAKYRTKGEGIVIAGNDTGFLWTHPAIRNQYRGVTSFMIHHDYNWHDSMNKKYSEPYDDRGHGTHTMGTMVGDDGGSNKIGVAPGAKWIGCRNMEGGIGTVSSYMECFQFFLAPYPIGGDSLKDGRAEFAPHIINNSWGCPTDEGCKGNEFVDVVRTLKIAGIFVVVSGGNNGSLCGSSEHPPGYYSGEITSVAAYDHRTGEIADFSSRGPSKWNNGLGPNISAPGEIIRSSVPGSRGYDSLSGTSMAAPHVAGVVALLWSAKPELIGKVDLTTDILQKTATPKTTSQNCPPYAGNKVPNAVFGHGLIDALAAIDSVQ